MDLFLDKSIDEAKMVLTYVVKQADSKEEAIKSFIKAGVPLNAYVIPDGDLATLKVNYHAYWLMNKRDIREWAADPLVKEKMIPIMEFILDATEGYLINFLKEKETNNALHC